MTGRKVPNKTVGSTGGNYKANPGVKQFALFVQNGGYLYEPIGVNHRGLERPSIHFLSFGDRSLETKTERPKTKGLYPKYYN